MAVNIDIKLKETNDVRDNGILDLLVHVKPKWEKSSITIKVNQVKVL